MKKFLQFILGFISAVIIIRLPFVLPVFSGIATGIFTKACIITTCVAAVLLIIRKTRFFGAGLIIPAGFFSLAYFILYLLFSNGFP